MYVYIYFVCAHVSMCSYVCMRVCYAVMLVYMLCSIYIYRCVCISLEAAEDTDVTLALSYVVSSASWSPQYDLRVFSSDKTMKVI